MFVEEFAGEEAIGVVLVAADEASAADHILQWVVAMASMEAETSCP